MLPVLDNPPENARILDHPLTWSPESSLVRGGVPVPEPTDIAAPDALSTTWVTIQFFPPAPGFEPDFDEPRTVESLAAERRRFVASVDEPLLDIELPPDDC